MSHDRDFAATLSELLPMIGVTLLDGLLLDGRNTVSFRRESQPPGVLRDAWMPVEKEAHTDLRGRGGRSLRFYISLRAY